MSDIKQKLKALMKKPCFTAAQARQKGIHPSVLAYYCKQGILERITRGVYRKKDAQWNDSMEWEDVALIAASIPSGVICLMTALNYYDLTDEFGREIWIAVPRKKWPPKRPGTRIVRMSNMTLGVKKIKIGGLTLKIFDRERTVINSFRYLSREVAIKALKGYLKRSKDHKPDLTKLSRYAKKLRLSIAPYVEAMTT